MSLLFYRISGAIIPAVPHLEHKLGMSSVEIPKSAILAYPF